MTAVCKDCNRKLSKKGVHLWHRFGLNGECTTGEGTDGLCIQCFLRRLSKEMPVFFIESFPTTDNPREQYTMLYTQKIRLKEGG